MLPRAVLLFVAGGLVRVLTSSAALAAERSEPARATATAHVEPARAAATAHVEPASAPAFPEPRVPAPFPQIAAVVPGLLVHGSGTWLQGRTRTTERLLLMEGTGLGLTLLGGFVLFRTGAARDVVGPAALTVMSGVSLFSLSLLSNLYAVIAPPDGFGRPSTRLPRLSASLGYLFVDDPQFSFHHFATLDVEARLAEWHLLASSAQAPAQGNGRWRLLAGYRFFGPGGARLPASSDGSYLELQLAFGDHRYSEDGFSSRTFEALAEGRLDLQRYLPDVRGAFLQLSAGLAKQWIVFDAPVSDTDDTSLLLGHFGFGVYFGRRCDTPDGGAEVELYYDHRHDGFAGGLKMTGLGSGVAGHFGLRTLYELNPSWAFSLQGEVGSAWTLGMNATWRTDGPW